MWDPDGDGPRSSSLVAGGVFNVAGGQSANNIAMFDPSSGEWSRLGNFGAWSKYIAVMAVAVAPNGELYCGGNFYQMDGKERLGIARWNGTEWLAVGPGLPNYIVTALAFLPNGDLLAGCSNGVVARWNGATWKVLGDGNGTIHAIAVMPDGLVVVGGEFSHFNDILVNNIVAWNGIGWKPLDSSPPSPWGIGTNKAVRALAVLDSGDLLVGGDFSRAGLVGALGVAKWRADKWERIGSGDATLGSSGVRAVLDLGAGTFVAAGYITSAKNPNARVVAIWNGAEWIESPIDSPANFTFFNATVRLADGRIAFGIARDTSGMGFDQDGVVAWNKVDWTKLGRGLSSQPAVVKSTGVDAYVGGGFTHVDGLRVNGIAYWSGVRWTPLGEGVSESTDHYAPTVRAIALDPVTQDVVVAGKFLNAGNIPAPGIARWDGLKWNALGNRSYLGISAAGFLSDGRLVVAGTIATEESGDFAPVAWFDGSVMRQLGSNLMGTASSLASTETDRIVVGGNLLVDGVRTNAAIWNGTTWTAIRVNVDSEVRDVAAGNETLFATGGYPNSIARRDGSAWQFIQPVPLNANRIAALSDQECFVAGSFAPKFGNAYANNIARWRAGEWSVMGAGLTGFVDIFQITDLDWSNGNLYVTGNFDTADSQVSARIARWNSNPRPRVVEIDRPVVAIAQSTFRAIARGESSLREVSLQWERESPYEPGSFEKLFNGPGGASSNGGTVSGASGQLPSPTDGTPATLIITNIQHSDAGNYRVTFWNSCGEATSIPVEIKVKAHITDINADGQVDDADFLLFLDQYDLMLCADPLMPDACSADFNQDGQVDDADFTVFIPAYNALVCP